MRVSLIMRDLRDGQVEMITKMDEISAAEDKAPPTAAAIMMVGAMTLYEAGILAKAGALALKAIEDGESPVEMVQKEYDNSHP